ncbi:MAG TPA: tripartite tricarboxylate transporter substrate-binding protein [Xanthobacteraceae bacterium]|nr:tripartite tricarboxylate transporter substrate-binding protein [Xanthobacteraceae bacterium]
MADLFARRPSAGAGDDRRRTLARRAGTADLGGGRSAGYAVDSWQGVFLPAKTAPGIVSAMSAEINAALATPAIKDALARNAYTAEGSTPEALRKWLQADTEKWIGVIKAAGIKID